MLRKIFKIKYIGVILCGVLIGLIVLGLNGMHEINEYVEENYGTNIDMDSNGNGTVYVKDGVIVAFQNIYHNDNYIALKVSAKNNDIFNPLQVTVSIKELEQEISFTVVNEDYEYIIIGDSQASDYDVDVLVEQKGLPLASGVVHVTHDKENASILTTDDILVFTEELKVNYLGMDESTHFFAIENNHDETKNILFSSETSGFHVNVDTKNKEYVYAKGLGTINVSIQTFDITVRDEIVKDDTSDEIPEPN